MSREIPNRLASKPQASRRRDTHPSAAASPRPSHWLAVTWLPIAWPALALWAFSLTGCTPWSQYIHNGFKVGPDYGRPAAPVAECWIDAADQRVGSVATDASQWWTAFNDPVLNELVQSAYQQNLSLREAGFRVLEARAQLGVAVGEMFPQLQTTSGGFSANGVSLNVANHQFTPQRWFDQWDYGFDLAWELDFWGRFRRAVEASEATLDASVEQYDDVLVTLLGDVAANYVQYRTVEQRLAYAQENVRVQQKILELATARFKGGMTSELDVNQAQSDLSNTESLLPRLRILSRNADNRLCILLGTPPEDLRQRLGNSAIPTAPASVAVGIPAELLRRRPDVRRAEREAAAQSAQIGVAEADFYPQFLLNGTLGWGSQDFGNLLAGNSLKGSVGPGFRWHILNYGRILNNVRGQDARFQELIATYQQTLLRANEEVENGLVRFLESQEEVRALAESVSAAQKSIEEAVAQYQGGLTDFNRVAVLQERLVQRQESLAQAQGEIALGLVEVYRALGGGWQIRDATTEAEVPPSPEIVEQVRFISSPAAPTGRWL
ncbi:MAG: efflux transporter outer membrane subunit [Pirellulaceae bacterium]